MTGLGKLAVRCRALLLCAVAISGCASVRVPAIDPSGERIFLPAPAATTLVGPADAPRLPGFPQPAFVAPPQPPPCGHAIAPAIAAPPPALGHVPHPAPLHAVAPLTAPAVRQDFLLLTPTRVIAPVGSEVVLVSGLWSAEGRYLAGEPIEWILSQESVGNFVDVGGAEHSLARALLHRTPRKLSNNYALARTSTTPQIVNRGASSPSENVVLQEGQSWISVSSPSEGTSHVTALAPRAVGWDHRRQTAAIHWVDAQWMLPPPAVVPAGQKHLLTTTVQRSSTGAPAAGWFVRYEIVGGPPAAFAVGGEQVVEIQTDASGQARVELAPQAAESGVAQVRIQIIRPALASGDLPRLLVGEGWTSVTWRAPGLAVAVAGPEIAGVDSTATYRVEISNPGDMTSRDVVVQDVRPPGLSFLNSNPPGNVFGDRVEWRLGDLPARAVRVIEINCRTDRSGDVRYCLRARSAEGLAAEGCAATRIFTPALAVQMTGPDTAQVGERAQFRIEVTNTGDERLTNVTVSDRFDPGLEHAEGERSPIVRSLGELAPGETRRIAVTFIVRQPGRLCHTLDVTADGGHAATARGCLTAAEPPRQANMRVRKIGPEECFVGEIAEYVIEVVNSGDAPLTNVQIVDSYSAALQPKEATFGFQVRPGELVWTIERLAPGETQTRQLNCTCLQPDPGARNRVTVTTDQEITLSDEVRTRISPVEEDEIDEVEEPAPEEPEEPPVSGELRVSIAETADPIRIGQRTAYLIVIQNDRRVSDKNVVLTIFVPEGMRFERLSGPVGVARSSPDGRIIELTPVAEIRAGESLRPFRVEVSAQQAGSFRLRAQVRSLGSPAPIVVEEETTVLME